MMDVEEEKREQIRLQGEIVQFVRIREGSDMADFVERGLAFSMKLPKSQIMVLKESVASKSEDKPFFWIYRTRESDMNPWTGLVLAGPFDEEVQKETGLFDRDQRQRWFDRFLDPFGEGIKWVEEINHEEKFSLKVGGGEEVGLAEIWEALESGIERYKKARKDEERYRREMLSELPRKGIRGEAAGRIYGMGKKIGKD